MRDMSEKSQRPEKQKPTSPFDAVRHVDEENQEHWLARELYKLLGYKSWQNFEPVIAKAKLAVKFNGFEVEDHFMETHKMIPIGKGGRRPTRDVKLSRYACYLIVQGSDAAKPIVALAKGYFNIQIRRSELADADAFAELSEAEKRLIYREHLRLYNRKLAQSAHDAGVQTQQEHATFSDAGYKGLYGGLTENDIHALKKLAPEEEISDWMDSEELGANIFRATQTDAALRRNQVKGREKAYQTHFTIGRKVRDFIINELGGTPPEQIPKPEKSIDHLKAEEAYRLKHRNQPSLFDASPEEEANEQ